MSQPRYQTEPIPGERGLQADGSYILDDTFEWEMEMLAKLDREEAEEEQAKAEASGLENSGGTK